MYRSSIHIAFPLKTAHKSAMARLASTDYDALAAFRYLLRKFLRFSKDYVKKTANLSSEQYEALLAIKALSSDDGVTIADLSERLQVKHHSAVNIVDRLVERKLIRREPGPHDRREKHLELTPGGMTLLEKLAAVHRKEIRRRSAEIMAALEGLKK
jgi:DNA-binding MarR family transcriptional regulator